MILLPTASTEDIFCQIIVPKKSKPSNKTHEKNRLKWSHSAWPQLFANSSSLHKIQRAELRAQRCLLSGGELHIPKHNQASSP